jgi:sugar lactone lactonase YvrE
VCSPRGSLYVSDWRGGVTHIAPNGAQTQWLATALPFQLRPNGIAPTERGTLLVAHLGNTGGVWEISSDGSVASVLKQVDGIALPPTNFVIRDAQSRTWISVSTRLHPRPRAWRPDVADGFIVLLDDRGARIVADGLGYTNEVRPDPSGTWLYAIETFRRRLIRFRIGRDGSLGVAETVWQFGYGCFPDGFAFDTDGGIWITSLVSNRILLFCDGRLRVVLEDVNPSFVGAAERAFASGTMSPEHLGPIPGTTLQQVTSIAFGGPDLRTAHLGSLHADCLFTFRTDVSGEPAPWWRALAE